MKNLLFLLFIAPIALFASTGPTAPNPGLDAITKALSAGDVETLAKYFDENLEISILDEEKTYTKAQAVEVVKTFFASNKPKTFNAVHNGTSKGNSDQFCIGNLAANSGNYRVYIYLKTVGANVAIKELRFDKE
jgi:hypothetical protein